MGLVWVPSRYETRQERLRRKTVAAIRDLKWFFVLPLAIIFLGSWLFDPPESFHSFFYDATGRALYSILFYLWAIRQIIRFAWH